MLMGSPEGGQGRKKGEWRITRRFFSASARHFYLHSVPKACLLALPNSKVERRYNLPPPLCAGMERRIQNLSG